MKSLWILLVLSLALGACNKSKSKKKAAVDPQLQAKLMAFQWCSEFRVQKEVNPDGQYQLQIIFGENGNAVQREHKFLADGSTSSEPKESVDFKWSLSGSQLNLNYDGDSVSSNIIIAKQKESGKYKLSGDGDHFIECGQLKPLPGEKANSGSGASSGESTGSFGNAPEFSTFLQSQKWCDAEPELNELDPSSDYTRTQHKFGNDGRVTSIVFESNASGDFLGSGGTPIVMDYEAISSPEGDMLKFYDEEGDFFAKIQELNPDGFTIYDPENMFSLSFVSCP